VKTIPTAPSIPLQRALQNYQAWDDSRDSFPGEHWLVLAAGLALLLAAGRGSSPGRRWAARCFVGRQAVAMAWHAGCGSCRLAGACCASAALRRP
jgi:hypothetical protein